MMRMQPYVDRSFARVIAYKRLLTGTLSLVGGGLVTALAVAHGGASTPLVPLAILVFFGGGAWALRDAVRVLRELRRGA